MSDFTAVRAVTRTLQETLRQFITLSPEPELNTVVVHVRSPKEMTNIGLKGISLWLYRLTRNADRLTEPRRRQGQGELVPVPLPMHLHYLITAMSGDGEGDHALLGRVLQVFHDRGILRGGALQDSLAGSDTELRVLMETLTTEELTRIWNSLQEPYLPSLTYEVQLIEIDAMRESEKAPSVAVQESVYAEILGDIMSAPYQVATSNARYLIVDDVRIVRRVVAFGLIRDEATGKAPRSPLRVQVSRHDLRGRATPGGQYAIATRPEISFAAPGSLPATFDVTLSGSGYRESTFSVTLPGPPFPFTGPSVDLRPAPVTVQGRVTDNATPGVPQPAATVVASDPGIIVTRTTMRFDHAAGVNIRRRTPSNAGAATILLDPILPGDRRLRVASLAGMAPNSLVRIGLSGSGEYGVVDTIDAPASAIVLTGGSTRGFAATAPVQRMNRGASTAAQPLTAPAFARESLLRIAAALPGTVIQIDDAGREEFHDRRVVADAGGFFAIPGVTGVRTLGLTVTAAGLNPLTIPVALDYSQPVQQVDFRLAP